MKLEKNIRPQVKNHIRKSKLKDNSINTSAIEPIGAFDGVTEDFFAVGWGYYLNNIDQEIFVDLIIDGKLANQGQANIFRSDLLSLGYEKPKSGFKIKIPNNYITNIYSEIELLINGTVLPGASLLDMTSLVTLDLTEGTEGYLDIKLQGWIGHNLKVDLCVDGRVITQLTLDKNKAMTNGDYLHTCKWKIPDQFQDGQDYCYQVTYKQQNKIVLESKLLVCRYPIYQFHIDQIDLSVISGWCIIKNTCIPINIGVYIDNQFVASGITQYDRMDVMEALAYDGLQVPLQSGFSIKLPECRTYQLHTINLIDIDRQVVFSSCSLKSEYEVCLDLIKNINSKKINFDKNLLRNPLKILRKRIDKYNQIQIQPTHFKLASPELKKIAVIIPVYEGAAETIQCIETSINSIDLTKHQLIIINDFSPNDTINNYLENLYYTNKNENLIIIKKIINEGFSASVNLGMVVSKRRDVILLNSDTLVNSDWVERLIAIAEDDPTIGTITPFSNNAEICSLPFMCNSAPISSEDIFSEIDSIASIVNKGVALDIPVAIGFCMYIKRECLDEVGKFDAETWGRGYGEEVDFCLKATELGWRHVVATDTFVAHRGGISFGAEKVERIKISSEKINNIYPFYNALINNFLKVDPIAPKRRSINFNLLQKYLNSERVLHITHSFGGGTERYLNDLIANSIPNSIQCIIKFNSDGIAEFIIPVENTVISDFFNFRYSTTFYNNEIEELKAHISAMSFVKVHVHSPFGMNDSFLSWIQKQYNYDVTLHDYSWICPRVTLTRPGAIYCNEPTPDVCTVCTSRFGYHSGLTKFIENIKGDIGIYRKNMVSFLNNGSVIHAGANDVINRYKKYGLVAKTKVLPYEKIKKIPLNLLNKNYSTIKFENKKIRIVLIGALSDLKGADVLLDCAIAAKTHRLPLHFYVIGETYNNDNFIGVDNVTIFGKYQEDQLKGILEVYEPDLCFFPNQWPETYSYTLTHALIHDLPIILSDIGAPAERVKKNIKAWTYPLDMPPIDICKFIIEKFNNLRFSN